MDAHHSTPTDRYRVATALAQWGEERGEPNPLDDPYCILLVRMIQQGVRDLRLMPPDDPEVEQWRQWFSGQAHSEIPFSECADILGLDIDAALAALAKVLRRKPDQLQLY